MATAFDLVRKFNKAKSTGREQEAKATTSSYDADKYTSEGAAWEAGSIKGTLLGTRMINGGQYYQVKLPNGYVTLIHKPGTTERAQGTWNTTWAPQWEKYGESAQRELQTAYERSLAEARGHLGYNLSSTGSGEGGLAEASRYGLEAEAQRKKMDIAAAKDTAMQQAYLQYMTTKDAQAFEMSKMYVQMDYNKKIAEMNDPSWWESLTGIVGSSLGMLTGGLPNYGPVSTLKGAWYRMS